MGLCILVDRLVYVLSLLKVYSHLWVYYKYGSPHVPNFRVCPHIDPFLCSCLVPLAVAAH